MDTKAFCGALAGLMLMSWLLRAEGEAASMLMSVTIYHDAASAPLFAGLFPRLQHVRLTPIGLRHIQKTLGDFGVRGGPRHAVSLRRLLPEKFDFLDHRAT